MSELSLPQVLAHLALTLLAPPALLGVITKVKALFAGRQGPPIWQPYWDLRRLWSKGAVLSHTTTLLFLAGPVVGLVTALMAAQLVPTVFSRAPLGFAGDLVFFAALFGLSRFFTVLAALDTGSAFEGMGAAREATFSGLAEPALLMGLLTALRLADATSIGVIVGDGDALPWSATGAPMLLVAVSLFIVTLAECSRIPFDDPNTHLELTMIHEVMVLDHSGPPLAFVLYGAAVKLFVFGALLTRLVLPFTESSTGLNLLIFAAGMLGVALAVGVVESTLARLRLLQVPRLLVSACLLSAFGLLLVAR